MLLLCALSIACTDEGKTQDSADAPQDSEPVSEETGDPDTTDTAAPLVAYIVRHAEKNEDDKKDPNDPHLTEEGQARAEALKELMSPNPLVAVFATDYNRTRETVQPTADDKGLEIQAHLDPEDELAKHILAEHQHQQVLAAGHSNTVPDLLQALGMEDPPDIDEDDFGDLWTVTISGDEVVVEQSRYGD